MAEKAKFKLYLSDGDTSATITESHPKLDATEADFEAAGEALHKAYRLTLTEVGVVSETTVFSAAN